MKYFVIDSEQALQYKQFILPHVRDAEEASEFMYVCAVEDESLVGLTVIDPTEEVSDLLSIAVSPPYQNRGVASGMLTEACRALHKENIQFLSVCYAMKEDTWPPYERFLAENSFSKLGRDDGFYNCQLKDLVESKLLEAVKPSPYIEILSLRELPNVPLREFSSRVVRDGLFAPIHRDEYHPDLSLFYLEEGVIAACFLVNEISPHSLENSWTYASPASKSKSALLELFAFSAKKASELYPKNTNVGFVCLSDSSDKLLHKITPNPVLQSIQKTYIRKTDAQSELFFRREDDEAYLQTPEKMKTDSAEQSSEEPELAFELVSGENLVCKGCVHRTEKLTSCALYASKPGNVMYGGACKLFETKG